MNNKKKWIVTAVVLAVFILAGLIYRSYSGTGSADADAPAPPPRRNVLTVNAEVIRERYVSDAIHPVGTLLPDEEVDLAFETSGIIESIHFEEGTYVRKGDLLAKVNDKPLQAQLARYEAQLQLAEDRVYRQSALLQKDAVSQEAYEQAKTELAILKADIDQVKANIALTELRAPFDGLIGLRYVSEGAYVSPSVGIANLTKLSPLKIDFSVPERYASFIRRGTNIVFEVDGSLVKYNATVYATESQVDVATRTLPVRAMFQNPNNDLLPGRSVYIDIKMVEISNAIAVPSEALVPEMGVDKVYLYKSGKAQPVEVTTGIRTDSHVQILRGLHVGDTLITSGTLQLRTGLEVVLDQID